MPDRILDIAIAKLNSTLDDMEEAISIHNEAWHLRAITWFSNISWVVGYLGGIQDNMEED